MFKLNISLAGSIFSDGTIKSFFLCNKLNISEFWTVIKQATWICHLGFREIIMDIFRCFPRFNGQNKILIMIYRNTARGLLNNEIIYTFLFPTPLPINALLSAMYFIIIVSSFRRCLVHHKKNKNKKFRQQRVKRKMYETTLSKGPRRRLPLTYYSVAGLRWLSGQVGGFLEDS